MGSLFSAPVLPADLQTMTEMPTTTATSRQSTSESALKRSRSATSTSSAMPAVMAAVSAMCAKGKTEELAAMVSSSQALSLRCLDMQLCIQGIVDEASSFQSDLVIRADQADAPADHIQARRCRLQHDILHGVSLINDAGDALQDRIAQVILPQHGVKGAVPPVMGEPHTRDVKRFRSFRERLLPCRNEQEFSIPVDVFRDEPGTGHAVHA